ncbi:MAG: hypothetical protein AB1405_14945 [Bdellovibrionota bacterium]
MQAKFYVRGEDRRKKNLPVEGDRRKSARRETDSSLESAAFGKLTKFLGALDDLIERAEKALGQVEETHDPEEVTQIPTRNPTLAGVVRALSKAQAELLELARAARDTARLSPPVRERVAALATRIEEVEGRLTRHMAARLKIDPPKTPPRAKRLVERIARLVG